MHLTLELFALLPFNKVDLNASPNRINFKIKESGHIRDIIPQQSIEPSIKNVPRQYVMCYWPQWTHLPLHFFVITNKYQSLFYHSQTFIIFILNCYCSLLTLTNFVKGTWLFQWGPNIMTHTWAAIISLTLGTNYPFRRVSKL